MLNIVICEDNLPHKKQVEKCVENCIIIHNLDMKIALSTDNPNKVVEYLKKEQRSGLYFLDVDLNHQINGINLASIIRDYDPRGFIVFITSHAEALPLTFHYKVEAMDFILKDEFFDFQKKIYDCILNAQKKYTQKVTELQKNFSITVYDKILTVEYSKIIYFETSVNNIHKIFLHSSDGVYEFYGALYKVESMLDEDFFRCHNSYIINIKQVLSLNMKTREVYFREGGSCPVSSRKLKALAKILQ